MIRDVLAGLAEGRAFAESLMTATWRIERQVKDAKIGEVRPKSSHQASAEDRRRMHCTHDEARRRISLRCDPQHPVVAPDDQHAVRTATIFEIVTGLCDMVDHAGDLPHSRPHPIDLERGECR